MRFAMLLSDSLSFQNVVPAGNRVIMSVVFRMQTVVTPHLFPDDDTASETEAVGDP